ncbi:MAG: type II toxin-antitoxin system VapC family toxin [Candidatus Bathyarchaeia archaeon]
MLAFSSWNIGEVLGAFDKAKVQNRINQEKHTILRKRFLFEVKRLDILLLISTRIRILSESWKLIEKYHVYQADALQIVSAKTINASQFLVSDKKLHKIAEMENLNSIYVI